MPSMITSIFTHFLVLFLVHLTSHEFLFLQASEFGPYSININTTCWEIERNALLKFKEGLKDPSGWLSSWVGNYCCTWSGVGCNKQTGHVTKLDLRMPNVSFYFKDPTAFDFASLQDLSSNNLEGEIPEDIMKLSTLGTLNLSRNQLTGNIPEKIGDLELLETLDLSVNHLSGPIPASMVSMTSLSHLNLSHNDLSGRIPSGNQFQTFNDPSIYEGNPKLCGAPLPTNCSTHKNDTPEGYTGKDRDESWSERLWFYIGTAFGFVVGFWTICGTLVIKRSWRHAYFRFVEEMKDRIYVFIVVKAAHLQKKLKGDERS